MKLVSSFRLFGMFAAASLAVGAGCSSSPRGDGSSTEAAGSQSESIVTCPPPNAVGPGGQGAEAIGPACAPTCGTLDNDCCAGKTCRGGLVCDFGICELASPCGASGQTCCANNTCNSGLTCQGGVCAAPPPPCGASGEVCCANSTCNAGLTCQSGRCATSTPPPCGALGEMCCAGYTCNGVLTCSGGLCERGGGCPVGTTSCGDGVCIKPPAKCP